MIALTRLAALAHLSPRGEETQRRGLLPLLPDGEVAQRAG